VGLACARRNAAPRCRRFARTTRALYVYKSSSLTGTGAAPLAPPAAAHTRTHSRDVCAAWRGAAQRSARGARGASCAAACIAAHRTLPSAHAMAAES
jgi:hypothetical protein